jgi:hypothetical protein
MPPRPNDALTVGKFHINYFLNTNKYSCASKRKLYLILLVFQYPVALQASRTEKVSYRSIIVKLFNFQITTARAKHIAGYPTLGHSSYAL